jgi:hypothetical protein
MNFQIGFTRKLLKTKDKLLKNNYKIEKLKLENKKNLFALRADKKALLR